MLCIFKKYSSIGFSGNVNNKEVFINSEQWNVTGYVKSKVYYLFEVKYCFYFCISLVIFYSPKCESINKHLISAIVLMTKPN